MRRSGKKRRLRTVLRILAGAALILAAGIGYALGPALYHRFYLYPRQKSEIRRLETQRRPTRPMPGWQEVVVSCHVHSYLSHDSDGRFEEILAAARSAGIDAVFMADHPKDDKADFSPQWSGLHGGVRFVPGFEMRRGFMPWGLPAATALDSRENPLALAARIHELGGFIFFAHIEEDRLWELPQLSGLELYNIHAAFKGRSLFRIVPEIILSGNAYPDQTLRLLFERPVRNLRRWDDLLRTRRIAAIAGNDAHQNSGLQGFYTPQDTFKLATTAPGELLGEWRLNAVTRFLLRLACGPLRTDGPLFRFEADRYGPMLRHVNNHLWVRDDAEPSLLDSLRRGRSLIAFTHLAGARGFQFWAETPTPIGRRYCMMSEEIPWRPGAELNIHSPMPCRFTLLRDGKEVRTHEGYDWIAPAGEPGKYRLEAELFFMGEWVPWIYTNPVTLTGSP